MTWLDQIPWGWVVILCLTIGFAPYAPPHLWEKLVMLVQGRLVRPIDGFDLALHAAPWLLAAAKAIRSLQH